MREIGSSKWRAACAGPATADGEGGEDAAARLILDLRTQGPGGPKCRVKPLQRVHSCRALRARYGWAFSPGSSQPDFGRLRRVSAGRETMGWRSGPRTTVWCLIDGPLQADDATIKVAAQFADKVLGVIREATVTQVLRHGLRLPSREDVVGKGRIIGCPLDVDVSRLRHRELEESRHLEARNRY